MPRKMLCSPHPRNHGDLTRGQMKGKCARAQETGRLHFLCQESIKRLPSTPWPGPSPLSSPPTRKPLCPTDRAHNACVPGGRHRPPLHGDAGFIC